jgi:SAM-dependent methyltransferase
MLPSQSAPPQGKTTTPVLDKLYSRENLLTVLAPYTVSTGSLHSPEWRQAEQEANRAWRWKYWRRRLRLDRSEKAMVHVKSSYEGNWQQSALPVPGVGAVVPCSWNDEAYFLRAYGEKRMHAFILNRIMRAIGPSNILEVGSGDGVFASVIAGGYPAASFTALELTESGIAKAKALQSRQPLAPELREFAPYSFEEEAVRKIKFVQGNSRKLPANDRAFDLVYTSLALEQMAEVKDEALREIARVSSRYAVLIEPFRDFNRDRTRRYFTGARDYFPLYVRELLRYGLRPIYVTSDFPAKITRGVGLVVAEVVA